MSSIIVLHACAVSFWFGVIGAEFVIERSRAHSQPHGYAVADNHFWIDVLLEVPVALIVLITGLMVLQDAQLTPWLIVKVSVGLIAVAVNMLCLAPVIQRRAAAQAERLDDVIRYSRIIDRLTLLGLPAGAVALILGVML